MPYSTLKISKINDPKLRLVYWFVLFCLFLSYLWGLYNDPETWMEPDIGHGFINVNVEGSTFSEYQFGDPETSPKTWSMKSKRTFDANDLRIPFQESGSIFLASSITPHLEQHRRIDSFCGDPTKPCVSDRDCRITSDAFNLKYPDKRVHQSYFGVDTNVCVEGFCLVHGWCPIQLPKAFKTMDESMKKWKLFFQAGISFAKYKKSRKNYDEKMTKEEGINEFSIQDILDDVGTDFLKIRNTGLIVLMTVHFQCLEWEKTCLPTINFRRVDNGVGFRWIYTQYRPKLLIQAQELPESRTTFELKGMRIVMSVHGSMFRFSWVGLILSFGSVIGLTVTATTITDFILLNIHKDRDSFVLQKYRFVQDWRIIEDVRAQLKRHLTNLGYY